MKFTKMHGIGNDYVYVDMFRESVPDPQALARRISDRHFGVGSDGLVLIMPSDLADVRMRMFNSDGSEAEMCGNAVRCVGKYAHDAGLVRGTTVAVETASGIKTLQLFLENGKVRRARVDMGEPELRPERIPVLLEGDRVLACPVEVDGRSWPVTAVSMGNPHAVVFLEKDERVAELPLEHLGPLFEKHPLFPRRVNTEFVEVENRHRLHMRVWERGAGETLACGTGACAVGVAAVLNGLTEPRVAVQLRGGVLDIEWNRSDNHVYMTGDAATVFTGEYEIPQE